MSIAKSGGFIDNMSAMITVETTDSEVRVTIPKDEIPVDRLNSFLDWLRFEAVARRSALTEVEADRLAEEVKAEWWNANKNRFIKPSGE